MSKKYFVLAIFLSLALGVGLWGVSCSFDTSSLEPAPATEEPAAEPGAEEAGDLGLANPASVYCVDEMGGAMVMHQTAEGQAGYCLLEDGRECEEWALFRSNGEECVAFEQDEDVDVEVDVGGGEIEE